MNETHVTAIITGALVAVTLSGCSYFMQAEDLVIPRVRPALVEYCKLPEGVRLQRRARWDAGLDPYVLRVTCPAAENE